MTSDRSERLRTLREIRRRLKSDASIVLAHHSPPGGAPKRWMARSAAFGDRADFDWAQATATGRMMAERLPLLAPTEEEELLREAGFLDVALFYAGFSFRGWVATAGMLDALHHAYVAPKHVSPGAFVPKE